MKKYLAFVAVIFTVILSSCSNDDIPVDRVVTFKLNPNTVVNNLYEEESGDLSSLSAGGGGASSLIVDLYIYDNVGKFLMRDTQEFNSYTHVMTSQLPLENGKYTIVATTHVTSSVDYWSFEGVGDINTFKIIDNGYIGGKNKILGLSVKEIVVSAGQNTFNIDIENAGAVACVIMENCNRFNSDIQHFGLGGRQKCEYLTTNIFGEVEYSFESSNRSLFPMVMFVSSPNYKSVKEYFFTFPKKNISLQFFSTTTSSTLANMLGDNFVMDIKRGGSYLFTYDVATGAVTCQDKTLDR